MGLQTADLLEPCHATTRDEMQSFAVILAPFEREKATKTGLFDESVVLDSSREPWLGELLSEHRRQRLLETKTVEGLSVALWGFKLSEFLKAWRQACFALKLETLAETPYQCRHAGPSRDMLLHLRTAGEIQRILWRGSICPRAPKLR